MGVGFWYIQNGFCLVYPPEWYSDNILSESISKEKSVTACLDLVKFGDDIQSERLEKKVQEDFYNGMRSGVYATPSFF